MRTSRGVALCAACVQEGRGPRGPERWTRLARRSCALGQSGRPGVRRRQLRLEPGSALTGPLNAAAVAAAAPWPPGERRAPLGGSSRTGWEAGLPVVPVASLLPVASANVLTFRPEHWDRTCWHSGNKLVSKYYKIKLFTWIVQ